MARHDGDVELDFDLSQHAKQMLVERVKAIFPMNYGIWNYQNQYQRGEKNRWLRARTAITPKAYFRHLDPNDRYWIGFPCQERDGLPVTTFLILDFDTDKARPIEETNNLAWDRLQAVVERIGRDIPPVVFSSPGGGYHAIWFLETETPLWHLVEKAAPQSRGVLFDIIRSAIGGSGKGTCEVFPQRGNIIRWPFGTDQHRVDLATARPIIETVAEAVNAVSTHCWTSRRLGEARLHERRPPEPQRRRMQLAERGLEPNDVERAERYAVSVSAPTVAYAQRLYREGLVADHTRNDALFCLALTMIFASDALEEFGFDRAGNLDDQLLTWLETKHNGRSADFGHFSRDYWAAECARVIRSARRSLRNPDGMYLLTIPEWNEVFCFGDTEPEPRHRFKLELIAACAMRKAKSSVLERGFLADADGTFRGEIHQNWWKQIPFCHHFRSMQRHRQDLIDRGFISVIEKGSLKSRHATVYSGFRLAFGAELPRFPYSLAELRSARAFLGLDSAEVEFCFVTADRFGVGLLERYGRRGVAYVESLQQRISEVIEDKRRASYAEAAD